jgi:hypothetical protein
LPPFVKKESITKFSDALLRSSGFGAEWLHLCRAIFLPHRQYKCSFILIKNKQKGKKIIFEKSNLRKLV